MCNFEKLYHYYNTNCKFISMYNLYLQKMKITMKQKGMYIVQYVSKSSWRM